MLLRSAPPPAPFADREYEASAAISKLSDRAARVEKVLSDVEEATAGVTQSNQQLARVAKMLQGCVQSSAVFVPT